MGELGHLKFVVLIEQAPLSDEFAQLMLSREQFKAISDAIFQALDVKHNGKPDFPLNDVREPIVLTDVREVYDGEEIDEMLL